MPEVSRIWRINGIIKPLAPATLADQLDDYDLPDGWHGEANGVTVPRGRQYGVAHFLVAQDDLPKILNRANTLDCFHEGGNTQFKNWWVESYEAVTKSKEEPAYWVRLADPRWLLERSTAQGGRFNLLANETEYVVETILGGTPYTWSQVVATLWALLPAGAGSFPGLAASVASTPENLYFDGIGAWRAINQCLTAIGQCIVYNPFSGTFSIVDLTAPQSISYPVGLLYDSHAGGAARALPSKAGVLFNILPESGNAYAPFFDKPHYLESTIGGPQGTHEIVDTPFYFLGRDLTGRAAEVAAALRGLLDPRVNPLERIYTGIWEQVPGSRISSVQWISDGWRGMQTIVRYEFEEFEWPQIPPYDVPGEQASGITIMAVFELDTALAPGIGNTANATVVLHNDPDLAGSAIVVRNTGMATGYAGARGLALRIKTLANVNQWWVIEIDQFCLQYTARLTSDTHTFSGGGSTIPGSRADQVPAIAVTGVQRLTPYPFSFYEAQDIHNPFNFHGKDGDEILVAHVEDGYTYQLGDDPVTCKNIIIAVFPDRAREFFVKLTANVAHGSITPTVQFKGNGPIGNNSGELPNAESATDRFYQSHLGRTNHTGIVAFDLAQEQYVVRSMEHWATRVKASFATSFCAAASTFQVDVLEGMNGAKPTGPLTVQNRYGINYAQAGDYLDILWDQIEGVWYPERTLIPTVIIEYTILEIRTEGNAASPFKGLKIATVEIHGASCPARAKCLVGNTVDVVDHSGCNFDEEDMTGYTGWATNMQFWSLQEIGYICETLSQCHWAAFNRCCAPDSGIYSEPCPEPE